MPRKTAHIVGLGARVSVANQRFAPSTYSTLDSTNERMAEQQPTTADMLEHAWRYFALHAGQRMSLFNFFLVVSGSIAVGLAAALQRGGLFLLAGVGLGCLLGFFSFIFWKLDQRTAFLVKHGEAGIIELEQLLPNTAARLLCHEPVRTAGVKKIGLPLRRMWTYGTTFRVVFAVMGSVGIVGAALCCFKWSGWLR